MTNQLRPITAAWIIIAVLTATSTASAATKSTHHNIIMMDANDFENGFRPFSKSTRSTTSQSHEKRRKWRFSNMISLRGGGRRRAVELDNDSMLLGKDGFFGVKKVDTDILKSGESFILNNNILGIGGGGEESDRDVEEQLRELVRENSGTDILGKQQSTISSLFCILNQSINIATAAIVGSGCLGAWLASWIIGSVCKLFPSIAANSNSGASTTSQGITSSILGGKWRWTILATISHVSIHAVNAINKSNRALGAINSIHGVAFISLLWIHSHVVNPIVGGMIGCSHALLGVISMMCATMGNVLDDLGDLRLIPLDDDDATNHNTSPKYLSFEEQETKKTIRGAIANILSSMGLFASFPQYFLGLYLVSSTILTWVQSNESRFGWKRLPWWNEGILTDFGDIANNPGAGEGVLNRWDLSLRLVLFHLTIMIVKGAVAFVCVCDDRV